MIEHVPQQVDNAVLYFHSAGMSSAEFEPFLPHWIERLPHTYLWAGDGPISGSPLMRQGLHYGDDPKRYWFTFPMQDASSPASFAAHVEAMGAALTCGGAYVNRIADQIMARFNLAAKNVVLCGFQHGSCIALAASMLRRRDPYAVTILFEPYILESYYLKQEAALPRTTVVCIDNQHIRTRTYNWMHLETDREFQAFSIVTRRITVETGGDNLDRAMMNEAIQVIESL
jgi:predicted esterase